MRHLRWKSKFISGFNCLDQSKRQLYQELQTLQSAMAQTEHCQDMRVLMDDLNSRANGLFEAKVPGHLTTHVSEIGKTLDQHLPLAALHTPACRACSLCDRTDASLNEWLDYTQSLVGSQQECAA